MASNPFNPIYGPVKSWRFGQSLGIDPIGPISTCSFNCIYCQLGTIQQKTIQRQIFVSTQQIYQAFADLSTLVPIDVITLSGSGEPTLALNLGEIIASVKEHTAVPIIVLTNGSLLSDQTVRSELQLADQVVVKLDAVSQSQLQGVNRPVAGLHLHSILQSLCQFSNEYSGKLALQTMLLTPWDSQSQASYLQMIQDILPDTIQLNVPARPRPKSRQLNSRENQVSFTASNSWHTLKCISSENLRDFATKVEASLGIPTSYPIIDVKSIRASQAAYTSY